MVFINLLEGILMIDKNKIKELKQKSIQKRKDLDLKLYLDLQKELVEYRSCIYFNTKMTIIELNKLRKVHNNILERLTKRLKIPTILSTIKK